MFEWYTDIWIIQKSNDLLGRLFLPSLLALIDSLSHLSLFVLKAESLEYKEKTHKAYPSKQYQNLL